MTNQHDGVRFSSPCPAVARSAKEDHFSYLKRKTVRFTLIELLIVIAIIAVLAGMLLPALAQAKGISVAAVCMNQQKQLASMNIQYSTDQGIFVPYAFKGSLTTTDYWFYTLAYQNFKLDDRDIYHRNVPCYVSKKPIELFTCPTSPVHLSFGQILFQKCSYGINADTRDTVKNTGILVRPEKLKRTSSTVMFYETLPCGIAYVAGAYNNAGKNFLLMSAECQKLYLKGNHAGGTHNLTMYDGHCERLDFRTVGKTFNDEHGDNSNYASRVFMNGPFTFTLQQ